MAILEAFLVHSHNQPPPRLSPPFGPQGESPSGMVTDIGLGGLGLYLETEKMPGDLFPVQSG